MRLCIGKAKPKNMAEGYGYFYVMQCIVIYTVQSEYIWVEFRFDVQQRNYYEGRLYLM